MKWWTTSAQLQRATELGGRLGAPLPTGEQIVVADHRRRAGASTITALLSCLLAAAGRHTLLVVDASEPTPTTGLDVLLSNDSWPATTIQQITANPPDLSSRSQAEAYLVRVDPRTWLLPQSTACPGPVLGIGDYASAVRALGPFFDLTVTDLGQRSAELETVPSATRRSCLVVPAAAEALRSATNWYERLCVDEPDAPFASPTLVVNHTRPPERTEDDRALRQELIASRTRGFDVVSIDYDPALSRPPIRLPNLRRTTQDAAGLLAASLLSHRIPASSRPGRPMPRPTTSGWFVATEPS